MLDKQEFTKLVAKNIKNIRTKNGVTQEQLAFEAKLYRTYVGHLENARYLPSSFVLHKIAEALNTPVSDIYPNK